MQDDNTIIEGSVKFRDGKKWKARWCVMRKLSPVADCVHLQLYRDSRARAGAGGAGGAGGGCKAALSLQRFLGSEAGFTLDKQSNTLALLCADLVAVLAFETRERLMQWQVKVAAHLAPAPPLAVLVAAGGRLPPGPARLHLRGARLALAAAAPPRLLGVWDVQHLRRYGVVDGRFCFEGGSLCGAGEGLHVLVADRAADIARALDLASRPRLEPPRRPGCTPSDDAGAESPQSQEGRASPAEWGAAPELGLADTASVRGEEVAWRGRVALERCVSCMSKLGAMSRSSTAALTPGAPPFSPAWTMDALHEAPAPARPPKPARPSPEADCEPARKPPMPLPFQKRSCSCTFDDNRSKIGPYENYDVPKSSVEIDGEHYDTPKRLKESLDDELFKITRSSTPGAVILKKPCGCLLKLGRRRRGPTVLSDDGPPPAACPCRRVTDWANSWIRLPYCRRGALSSDDLARGAEAAGGRPRPDALYATIDFSRKTRRRTHPVAPDELTSLDPAAVEVDEGPLANYENLNFALSLEYYENAKDLLRRAGVTQSELDAISANLRPRDESATSPADDYLMMEPKSLEGPAERGRAPAGYTPMSPIGGFAFGARSHSELREPPRPAPADPRAPSEPRRRSRSADSSRFLDDTKDSDGRSCSSTETLRHLALEAHSARCGCVDADSSSGGHGGGAAPGAGNRDSSSSNDSGVSSCSQRRGRAGERPRFELPLTTSTARRHYRGARRADRPPPPPPRRARSQGPPAPAAPRPRPPHKCSSAEAEVPVLLPVRALRGVADAHSTSSGTSDMSDYIETLSICSSHSSTDTPVTMRVVRPVTSTLRPRSGKEYGRVPPRAAP